MIVRTQPHTTKRKGLVAALALALMLLVFTVAACGGTAETTTSAAPGSSTTAGSTGSTAASTGSTSASLAADLNGAGATFPQPVYVEWIGAFQAVNPDVKINYQGVGSGAGIQQFTGQTVDFGASDAFMKDEEIQAAEAARAGAKVLHIPTVFGAIVLAYNLPGVEDLKLDSDTLAKIFLEKVTTWDDPAIKALNPDAQLPSAPIQTVHRSDSSGTTNGFTSYLAAVSADWAAGPGKGKEIKWPGGVGGKGNDGVAAVVKQTEGAIGYVELAYATQNNMTMAQLKNQAGNFIAPSLESTSAAAEGITIPADMNLLPLVSNSANPQAYPIVTSTYVLTYDKMPDAGKAAALKAFLTWALSDDGTAIATELGYAPLPADLKAKVLEVVALIGS
jgi:phosphate transport system substrate-binding protein